MWKWILLVLAAVAVPRVASAQALADRVPADAVIYIGWHGVDGSIPGYEQSHLKALVEASQVSQLIHDSIPQMVKRLTADDAESAAIGDGAVALSLALWGHPSALYFEGMDGQGQMPKIALMCQAGADAPALAEKINNLIKPLGPVVRCVASNDLLIISTFEVNDHPTSPLASDPEFTAATGMLGKTPFSCGYVNGQALNFAVGQVITASANPQLTSAWPKIRTALGLDGLKSVASECAFDGKDWVSQVVVDFPSPRTGIFAMAGEPITDDFLKFIPNSAAEAGASSFDLAGLVQGILDAVTAMNPDAGAQVNGGLAGVTQMLGLDPRKDLLEVFGKQWGWYLDPDVVGYGVLGGVVINRPSDPAKLQDSLTKTETFLSAMIAPQLEPQKMKLEFREFDASGVQIHYLATPMISPAWAIKDGTLFVGLYPQSLAATFARPGDGKSILDNPAFVQMRRRLGASGKITAISYVDLPRMLPQTYQTWLMNERLYMGGGDLFGLHSPPMLMPTLKTVMDETTPAGSAAWSDDTGIHVKSIMPYPGAQILASGTSMSPMSMVQLAAFSSIILPSLTRARGTANMVSSAANLRQIGLACMMYSNDHKGPLPPDLGTLIKEEDIPLSAFVAPDHQDQLPPNAASMSPDESAAWINAHSDYVYLGAGKKVGGDPSLAVAYEKDPRDGKINVLFNDFHAEMLPEDKAQDLIARSK